MNSGLSQKFDKVRFKKKSANLKKIKDFGVLFRYKSNNGIFNIDDITEGADHI